MSVHVQFSDKTQQVVIVAFASEQDKKYWKNLGEIEEDDERYIAFLELSKKAQD